jgi:predicted RNA-binding protein YlxR (DUF448 family)
MPSGIVAPDPSGRAAGRGAYVCRTTACLEKAITKGALSRALKTTLPSDLFDLVAGSLTTQMTPATQGGANGQE